MAAPFRKLAAFRSVIKRALNGDVMKNGLHGRASIGRATSRRSFLLVTSGLLAAAAFYGTRNRALTEPKKKEKELAGPSPNDAAKPRLTQRERRFVKFASIEYDGQIYMTPQDFIESVTENEPRSRLKRRLLSTKELENIQNSTPPVWKGSPTFFRGLHEQGLVSYTEYLFLLSILTKPHSGFHIAFNMFDTDGNRRVDREEFLVLAHLIARFSWKESGWHKNVAMLSQEVLERIFSYARLARQKARRRANGAASGKGEDAKAEDVRKREEEEDRRMDEALKEELQNVVNTTLLVHFFGKKGKGMLCYEDFRKFMENLQTEVLQIEFNEFSKGLPVISELDFAKILLRYTLLHSDDHEAYLNRLVQRIQHKQGITFEEFKAFCQFLNNLEDFGIAMRMYTLADRSISPEEFNRAVKICTGQSLSPHLVDTVFQIFDEDDDGQLSYKEFIAIMRDRLHRGIKPHAAKNEGWEAFKTCVKEEMRAAA